MTAIIDKAAIFSHKTPIAVGEMPVSAQEALPEAPPVLIIQCRCQIAGRNSEEVRRLRFSKRVTRRHRARTTQPDAERPATRKGYYSMYAVIKTGGKQYRVVQNDILTIERLAGEAGSTIEFDEVLMVGEGESVKVGAPLVAGAKVTAELVEQTRGPKVIAFKKRRRKNSRRKRGHRQDQSLIRITAITGA